MKDKKIIGPWVIEYSLKDGGRIDSLSYNRVELLTTEPLNFQPPNTDYGEYETRPVYGYDDCFPSVDSCSYPNLNWKIPDHGELCWLIWDIKSDANRLIFSVDSKILPISFTREIQFTDVDLIWIFEVRNKGEKPYPFQHVMHPLMPLSEIIEIKLPEFDKAFDEISQKDTNLIRPEAVQEFLLNQPTGSTNMLFLNNIKNGIMAWKYQGGLCIEATFSKKMFPSIGIWWNNSGYPAEDNCRRNECALEPTPGDNSVLSDAFKIGKHLEIHPDKTLNWKIHWRIVNDL